MREKERSPFRAPKRAEPVGVRILLLLRSAVETTELEATTFETRSLSPSLSSPLSFSPSLSPKLVIDESGRARGETRGKTGWWWRGKEKEAVPCFPSSPPSHCFSLIPLLPFTRSPSTPAIRLSHRRGKSKARKVKRQKRMSGQASGPAPPLASRRHHALNAKRAPSVVKKAVPTENGTNGTKPTSPPHQHSSLGGERTVKKLRLSKALTIPEGTTVSDACRRMATRRVDAVLLTDSNALLSGIVTDKDIATRVIAEGLRPEQTIVSKIMTRNPVFVNADSLAIEALQKMVQGKFRHLPVVENGEVIALLDITKCLYDAISKMERAAEKGSAIAAAVEGVERQWGSNFSGPYAFIETLRERMFKPSLSTIVTDNTRVATVLPSDPVYVATKRMREFRVNSVIIVNGNKPQGILTSKDVLMRVVAQNLSPELTLVEKVMTQNPECATLQTTILDALHIMHDGKFLHLPVVDKDGCPVACVDVLQITHAAISMVEGSAGAVNDVANTMMQKFWDSALALEPPEDGFETQSDVSGFMASDGAETSRSTYPSLGLGNNFTFKFEDQNGHVHRFNCGSESLGELVSAVMQRIGYDVDQPHRPQLLYEDDEGDRVLLTNDSDLAGAISHARLAGLKVLRLRLEYPSLPEIPMSGHPSDLGTHQRGQRAYLLSGVTVGAAVVAGIGLMVYLRRSNS